jgi:outer membrane scaffolding protein for murein synthesis (MipA/OmpV family)
MNEIDDTVEVGAFADIVWANPQTDRRQRFILGAKLYQDVGDVSDGFRANISARYWQPVAKAVDLNFTAGFVYQDDDYTNTYYGVNSRNAGTSGLAFLTPMAG